jgi:ATP-dependent DNA helicase RecG
LENNRGLATQLGSLRFYDSGKQCPTNAGILLLGKNPLQWLAGSVRSVSSAGGKFLNRRDISREEYLRRPARGSPRTGIARRFAHRVTSCIGIGTARAPVGELSARGLAGAVDERRPARVIRIHRTDSFLLVLRQVEIQIPGGLYGEASPENFPNQNSYRNPVLAEAMKALGFVNRFGRGVLRAQEALAQNGNGPAEFQFDAKWTRLRLVLNKFKIVIDRPPSRRPY